MVMLSPFGTSERYFETGSSSLSLPSCTSCRMTVPVHVLVTEPMRMWSSSETDVDPPALVTPYVRLTSP